MALMFFPDPIGALREMARSRPTVPSWTWPGGRPDPQARSLLDTYFSCGDLDELTGLVGRAGLRVTDTETHGGTARFGSVDAFVTTEVESTPLRKRISAGAYHRIKQGAREVLAPFTAAGGTLAAPFQGHVVRARPSPDQVRETPGPFGTQD
jgi:hypothetical protein